MSVDLLHELATVAPAPVEQLEKADLLLQQMPQLIQRVRWAVEHSRGSVTLFENTWRSLVHVVAKGRTAEVQAVREQFLKAVEDRLRLLQHTQTHVRILHDLRMPGIPDPAFLLPELTGMERIKSRVCDLWQTAEDLEDLAARDYPLTTADLDRIGPQHQPPASWYAEEGKPF
jgi:hypothetical protein